MHTLVEILIVIWCAGWWTYLCHTTDGRIVFRLFHAEDGWLTTILMFVCASIILLLAPIWYPLMLLMTWRWR